MSKSILLHPSEDGFQGKHGIELADLFAAYADCRRNKRRTMNALAFEVDYERELIALHEDINTGIYQPGRSMAFVVDKPVKREIFAADFRDRVVHHLIINKLNPLFEKEFIYDSYACRSGRGTHFIKHDLGVRYYGRYVDDFVLVHQDLAYLKSLIPIITDFLKSSLKLTLHPKKMHLQHYTKGVNFLGVVIKPHRITSGRRIKGNFYDAIARQNHIVSKEKPSNDARAAFLCSMNSYLGLMKHYSTYRLRRRMLKKHLSIWWWNLMCLSGGASKLVPKQKSIR